MKNQNMTRREFLKQVFGKTQEPRNRFEVGQTIVQYRYDEPIRIGVVVKGPMRAEGIDHYHVKWTWEHQNHQTHEWLRSDVDLICDMPSQKYFYK